MPIPHNPQKDRAVSAIGAPSASRTAESSAQPLLAQDTRLPPFPHPRRNSPQSAGIPILDDLQSSSCIVSRQDGLQPAQLSHQWVDTGHSTAAEVTSPCCQVHTPASTHDMAGNTDLWSDCMSDRDDHIFIHNYHESADPSRAVSSIENRNQHVPDRVANINATDVAGSADHTKQSPTPLPQKTMFVLCAVIFSEPMSMTILFPFVYYMVRDFHFAEEKDIGFYVGFIASAFSLAQFVTSVFWGWLSDRVGRRPVLLIGLLGNAVSIVLFGFSRSLAWAIASRAACGLLNGNIGVAKSVLGEITDSTNRPQAFSVFGLMFGIGMIIGPMLGGFFAHPAVHFPFIFGKMALFHDYPYLLPCLISTLVSICGFMVGLFHLPETARHLGGYQPVNDQSTPIRDKVVFDDQSDSGDQRGDDGGDRLGYRLASNSGSCTRQSSSAGILHAGESDQMLASACDTIVAEQSNCIISTGSHQSLSPYNSIVDIWGASSSSCRISESSRARSSVATAVNNLDCANVNENGSERSESTILKNAVNPEDIFAKRDDPASDDTFGIGRPAVASIAGYALLSFQTIIFDEVFPIWAVTSPSIGLGFTEQDIGACLSIMGVVTIVCQVVIYPMIAKNITCVTFYRLSLPLFIVLFSFLPLVSMHLAQSPALVVPKWICLLLLMSLRYGAGVASFTSVNIMVANSARPGQLGLVNGIGQMSASLVRAVGPALGGILWAWSCQSELPFPLDARFVFVLMAALAVVSTAHAWVQIPASVSEPAGADECARPSPAAHV